MKYHNSNNARTNALRVTPETRQTVLNRDGHRCVLCHSNFATSVHHIVPKARSGLGIEQNLVTLCAQCHRDAHDVSPTETSVELLEYVADLYAHPDGFLTEQDLTYNKYA